MRPFGARLFATKYRKPETVGSLVMPEAWRTDNSRSLWFVKESSEEADAKLGLALLPEWIVVTPPHAGVYVFHEDGEEVYVLWAREVRQVIPWTSETEDVKLTHGQLLVRVRAKEERFGLFVSRADDPEETETAEVVRVGDVSEEISEGDVVVFSRYVGVKVKIGGEELMVLDERSVLALT